MTDRRDVFISHHSGTAGHIAHLLCNLLEKRGITCWYAPRDVHGYYPDAIAEAIKQAKIFILLMNREACKSDHVKSETEIAFDVRNKYHSIALVPVMLEQFEVPGGMHYLTTISHKPSITSGADQTDELRYAEVVDYVEKQLHSIINGTADLKGMATHAKNAGYTLLGYCPSPDKWFVGREREITEILQILREDRRVVLVGMGGTGKTELAKKVAERCKDDYDTIMWVSFQSSIVETVVDDNTFPVYGMDRENYPDDDDLAYYYRKMRIFRQITNSRVLLIIDNFDVLEDKYLDDFCKGTHHILYTSRYIQIASNMKEVIIGGLEHSHEQMALFQKIYVRPLDAAQKQIVSRIIEYLHANTLGIRLVAASMRAQRILPNEMLRLLVGDKVRRDRETRAKEDIRATLERVFHISELTEEEVKLLKNLALFPISGVLVEDLYEWCGFDDFALIDGLVRKSWVNHDIMLDRVHLHPMIADLMLPYISQKPSDCVQLVNSMYSMYKKQFELSLDRKDEYLGFIASVYRKIPVDSELYIKAAIEYGMTLLMVERYRESVDVIEKLLAVEKDTGKQIVLFSQISHSCIQSGWIQAGFEYAQRGYQLFCNTEAKQVTAEAQLAFSWILQRLCECSRIMGKFDDAERYGRDALKTAQELGTEGKWDEGWSRYHLAYVLLVTDRAEESMAHLRSAISVFEGVGSTYSCAYTRDLMSQGFMLQGLFDDAVRMASMALEIYGSVLDPMHSDRGYNYIFFGNIYRAFGQDENACIFYGKAVDILKRNHPERAALVSRIMQTQDLLIDIRSVEYRSKE